MITWKMKPDGKNATVEHSTQTSGTCYSQSVVAKQIIIIPYRGAGRYFSVVKPSEVQFTRGSVVTEPKNVDIEIPDQCTV